MEKGVGQELCRFVQDCVEMQVTKWLCLKSSVQFVQTMRNEDIIPM